MKDDFNSVCTLIKTTETVVDGVLTEVEITRDVFCSLLSNTFNLKSDAGKFGTNAEIKLKLADISEYGDEKFLSYDGKRYEITRIYQNGYELELTCVRGVA